MQSLIYIFLSNNSWPIFACAAICLTSGYLITGGLHIDGLMDTFDGLYAGRKKMLKAMKDSRVGSFGVQSIIFITLLQLASLIKIDNQILYALPICLFWGRFSTLIHIDKFRYLSHKKKSISHKKNWRGLKREATTSLGILLIIILCLLFNIGSKTLIVREITLIVIGLYTSFKISTILGKRIEGFNGDSCGACVVITETVMLLIHAILL